MSGPCTAVIGSLVRRMFLKFRSVSVSFCTSPTLNVKMWRQWQQFPFDHQFDKWNSLFAFQFISLFRLLGRNDNVDDPSFSRDGRVVVESSLSRFSFVRLRWAPSRPQFPYSPVLVYFSFFLLIRKEKKSHRKQISFKDHSLPLGKREKEWVSDSFELGRGKTFADSPRSIFLFFFPFYPARGSGAQFPQVPWFTATPVVIHEGSRSKKTKKKADKTSKR